MVGSLASKLPGNIATSRSLQKQKRATKEVLFVQPCFLQVWICRHCCNDPMLLRLASKDQQQEVQEGLDAFRKAILEAVEKVGEFAPWVQQSELFGECCWVKVNEKNCRHTFQGCFPDAKKLCSQGWQVGSGKLAGTFGAHEALAQGGKGPFYTEVSQEPKLLGVSGALDLDPLGFLSIERGAPESLIPRARLWSRSAEVDGRDSEPLLCQSLECGSVAAVV